MWKAVTEGATAPPFDQRYVQGPKSRVKGASSSAEVVSFLLTLYESVAETLPDVKDVDGVVQLAHEQSAEVDPYASSIMEGHQNQRLPSTIKPKAKTRKRKFGMEVRAEDCKSEVRFLPPGTMKEHYEVMISQDGFRKISFKCFWQTWVTQFPHLKMRSESNHVQCAACLHHRLLIKEFCNHVAARQKQTLLLKEHLASQYRDRVTYWQLRGSSRLSFTTRLVVMIDGMDQCKFTYPRSAVCRSKDLSTLQRPRLHVVGILAHGFGLMFAMSGHNHPKDSSAMSELIVHLLSVLKRKHVRLDKLHLHVMADNTSRELKNSTVLRLLSMLVMGRVLNGATLGHLRSGHSHEDLGQVFGSVAAYLVRHSRESQTPDDFKDILSRFTTSLHRPFESYRDVFILDQHRDWKFGYLKYFFYQSNSIIKVFFEFGFWTLG